MSVSCCPQGTSRNSRSHKSFLIFLSLLFAAFLAAGLPLARGADPAPQQEARVSLEARPNPRAKTAQTTLASLRVDLKVVLVPVSVTDALDHFVTSLPAERFRVSEDGVEQKIACFSREEGPVSVGFLFDSSGSMKNRIATSVEALKQFFLTSVEGDEYSLIQFSDKASLLSGFTTNPQDINQRLGYVKANGWTALLDAVALGTHQMKHAKNPRKVLLILSDGGDNNSRYSESEVRSRVMESDVRVYAVGIMTRPRLLEQLAQDTGGKVLVAQTLKDLPEVVRKLSAEIRSQYVIGYSSGSVNDGKFHKVKVELLPAPGAPMRVSWRRGFFAPGE